MRWLRMSAVLSPLFAGLIGAGALGAQAATGVVTGVPTWSGFSQAELRDALLAERGRELYAEGVRRADLIRAGTFISSALARGAAAKPGNVLFPIPLEVIQQSNGIITQNPGY